MGKMRDSLNVMTVRIGAFEDRTEKLSEEIASLATNVQKTLERVYGGTELLYMYLTQKATQEGTTSRPGRRTTCRTTSTAKSTA